MALAARQEISLREVAERARELGSPEVIVIQADVTQVDDCRRLVDETMNHFQRRTLFLFLCFSRFVALHN